MTAKKESGLPNKPVQNTKALLKSQNSILVKAIGCNPASAELALKRIEIFENHYGVASKEVTEELQKVLRFTYLIENLENLFLGGKPLYQQS